jgi:hypothetical protein
VDPLLTTCEDCGAFCSAVAFLGEDDRAYIYDLAHNVLATMSLTTHSITRVVRGPAPMWLRDGTALADGTVYLLVDRGTLQDRYGVFYRTAADTSWHSADTLDDDDIGWSKVAGRRVPVVGSVHLGLNALGKVELYQDDRRSSPAIVVGDRTGIRAGPLRRRLPTGAIGPAGQRVRAQGDVTVIESAGQACSVATPGGFLGTDSLGNVYLRSPRREPGGTILQRYSPQGRLLASVEVPSRPLSAQVSGKGPYQVSRSGDVYQFRLTAEGLVVTRWTTAEGQ